MNKDNHELLEKAIEDRLNRVIFADDEDERRKAVEDAAKLIDRINETDKVEDAKKGSKISTGLQILTLVCTVAVTPALKYLIDRKHIREICKLEGIDTFVTTPAKGLLRSWFQFK